VQEMLKGFLFTAAERGYL